MRLDVVSVVISLLIVKFLLIIILILLLFLISSEFMLYYFRPEAFGVVTGCTFLITMFVMIPVIFSRHMLQNDTSIFPHSEVIYLYNIFIIKIKAYISYYYFVKINENNYSYL